MTEALSILAGLLLKAAAVLLAANEVRGLIMAGPVLYEIARSGGTLTAIWVGLCSLLGIVFSVVVPLLVARKLKLLRPRAG